MRYWPEHIVLLVICLLVAMLVMGDIGKRNCLDAGYPDSYMALNLDVYCLNVDGSITGIVHKLEGK